MIAKCDFHIHSCLSPCGDLLMSPATIISTLKERNVQIAALTDHNTALNCEPFMNLCRKNGIAPLAGLEVQTIEEVHILCLFADLQNALILGKEVYDAMPNIPNDPERNGDQVYVDEDENILGEIEKYLITSAEITIDDLAKRVHQLNGIVIPAHVDRPVYSLTSQLGFIPDGEWDALETVRPNDKLAPICDTKGYPITHSSDAHYIEHIARRTTELNIDDNFFANLIAGDKKNGTSCIETIRAALQKLER